MPQAIDLGDAQPTFQQAADTARASFEAGTQGATAPATQFAPAPALKRSHGPAIKSMPNAVPLTDPNPQLAAVDPAQPDDAANIAHPDYTPAPPPPPAAAEDNTNEWDPHTFGHFLRDTFKGTGAELKDIAPRVAAKWGSFLTMAGAGLVKLAGSAKVDPFTDAALDLKTTGEINKGNAEASDAVASKFFDFKKDYIDTAIDHWTPQRASDATGAAQGEGSGPGAAAIGRAGEVIPDLFAGPAGVADLVGRTANESAESGIDQGHSTSTAVAEGTVDGIASMLQLKWGVIPTMPLLKRVMSSIGLGGLMQVTANVTKKKILEENGYAEDADKINPTEGLGEATIQNALFGAFGGKKKLSDIKPTEAPKSTEAVTPPPPAPTAAEVPPPVPGQPPAPAAPVVPDRPTAEPAKDLRAQFRDMNDPTTPRSAVFLSSDNKVILTGSKDVNSAAINGQLAQAAKQGRVLELPNGSLVLKNKAAFKAASDRIAAGEDPQVVIGQHTGSGDGSIKSPDQTAVVQGHDVGGNVAVETMVKPEEVPVAARRMTDQGKTPVVTTPEAALQRRMDGISTERNTPTQSGIMKTGDGTEVGVHIEPGAPEGQLRVRVLDADGEPSPHSVDVPAERVRTAEKAAEPAKPEIAVAPEPAPDLVTAAKNIGEKGIAIVPGKEGFQLKVDGKISGPEYMTMERAQEAKRDLVTMLGDPDSAKPTIVPKADTGAKKVTPREFTPEEMTKGEQLVADAKARAAAKVAPAETPKPKAKVQATAFDSLPEALSAHEGQEMVPDGKKFATSLAERQDNASAFAMVLKEAAKETGGPAAERAIAAAKAAEGMTNKSKEATEKGQGTGHVKISALVSEMHKAARELMGSAKAGDEVKVPTKVAELKAKVEKAKAREAAPERKPVVREKPAPVVPKRLPHEVEREANRLRESYMHADDDKASQIRTRMEQLLHEVHGDTHTPADISKVLHLLDEMRHEAQGERTKRFADTAEDLDHTEFERPETGFSTVSRPALIDQAVSGGYRHIAKLMQEHGFIERLLNIKNTGEHIGAHDVLKTIASMSQSPAFSEVVHALQQHAPDVPIYVRDVPISPRTGQLKPGSGGLFTPDKNVLQITVNQRNPATLVKTLLHELTHAATAQELARNPNGALAKDARNALSILRARLTMQYGSERMLRHLDFFDGKAKQPNDYVRGMYGVANEHEMMAEVLSNPDFQKLVADSEKFAQPGESFDQYKSQTLLGKVFDAIGNFFGVKDPRLLNHILNLTEGTMRRQQNEAQMGGKYEFMHGKNADDFAHEFFTEMRDKFGSNIMESEHAMPELMALSEEPPRLRGTDDELHSIVDDQTLKVARAFKWATKTRAIDGLRTVVMHLKTMDQLFRDHRKDFGAHDDHTNPLVRLEDVDGAKSKISQQLHAITRPVAEKWSHLSNADDKALGQLMIDTTMYKLDPRKDFAAQSASAQAAKGAEARHAEFQTRLRNLTPEAREVYGMATDANRRLARELRRVTVDAAIRSYSDTDITAAQRALLYGARDGDAYEGLIGKDKLIDVGERNEKLTAALQDLAGTPELDGPYHHLGRDGDYIVSVNPEGTREFDTQAEAEHFARTVSDLSPRSKGVVAERGGKFAVDYKAHYVSMHESRNIAEIEAARLRAAGLDVGHVTTKTLDNQSSIGAAARDLVTEAERKINRNGKDTGTEALIESLRSAFLQMSANRSAYAGSKLARKNVGGVKPLEMRRNFSAHAMSSIWHASQVGTLFDQASAMADIRHMARDSRDGNVSQDTMYRRGELVKALNKHTADEVSSFGKSNVVNSHMAKLGFMSYLASPSHAFIWMTQNFTTGIPVAGARWGYAKATAAFAKGMRVVSAPAFRSTMHAIAARGGNAADVHEAIMEAVRKDPELAKWATGPNSHLQQLVDRGVINHSYSEELANLAKGGNKTVDAAFEWARLLPNMADAWNRVSTAIAALEATGGDIRKTADFVREIHADYGAKNKPLAFKALNRIPGANTITMFKTYVQSMAHLLYGNIKASYGSDRKAEAAKTVAGMVVAHALFAGVYSAAAIEPLRLALFAYHKLFDQEGEVYDLRNQIHLWLTAAFGKTGGDIAANGVPHMLGFDLSSRMGLANLFFHNPPDLLTADKDVWKDFMFDQMGTMTSLLAENVTDFTKHMQNGQPFQAFSSVIPVKAWHDATKAYELYDTGKLNGLGASMTKPSSLDAAWQLFGLKPASVAIAQERSGVAINYNQQVKATKDAIIKAYVSATNKADARTRIANFNRLHPAEVIRPIDLIKMQQFKQRVQNSAPVKDREVNRRTNF